MTDTAIVKVSKPLPWKQVVIRVARDEAGDAICRLMVDNGAPPALTNCDWSRVFPHWLIATLDDQVIGCIQLATGRPFGYLDFLFVAPGVSKAVRAVAVKKLLLVGCAQLRAMGSELAIGFVENALKSYKTVLKNNGVVIGPQGNCFVKRLVKD